MSQKPDSPSHSPHPDTHTGEQTSRRLGIADQARLKSALRDGWKLTPATFGHKITNGRWIAARHLLYISTIVATEVAKGNARIIVTMPARHGKSELISVNTPGWFLEKWPYRYVMSISYGAELATDFSLKVRDMFQNEDLHHLLNTRIRSDKKRVDRWLTPSGGGLTAAGVGGPLTGRGADLMIIDDYVKNAENALSVSQLKNTWEWFKSTAYTRLEPGGSLIILATRWGIRDLIGMCLDEMPEENWLLVNLPALAEAHDPLGREPGEALWPERYSRDDLLRIKAALGDYWWSAMYQQRPKPSMAGADLGDKMVVISRDEIPHWSSLKRIRAWDLAASEGTGDYTAGPKLAYHKETGRIIIEDMQRFRKSARGNELMIKTCAEGDGHGVPIWMEQEPGSSGKTIIGHYTGILKEYSFKGERATGPIEVRAAPFLAAAEAGRVVMVKAHWNEALREELNAFPDGEHDDQIIALALGYNKLIKGMFGGLTWGRDTTQKSNVIPIRSPINPQDAEARVKKLTW